MFHGGYAKWGPVGEPRHRLAVGREDLVEVAEADEAVGVKVGVGVVGPGARHLLGERRENPVHVLKAHLAVEVLVALLCGPRGVGVPAHAVRAVAHALDGGAGKVGEADHAEESIRQGVPSAGIAPTGAKAVH